MATWMRRSLTLLTLLVTLTLTTTTSASPLDPKARGLWAWLASTWSWVAAWAKAEAPSGLTEGMPGDRGDAGVNIAKNVVKDAGAVSLLARSAASACCRARV